MKTLLFLDAELRSTLALVRSIGSLKKYRILTSGRYTFSITKYSRYSNKYLGYQDPTKNKEKFLVSLEKIIEAERPDYILPGSDITLLAIFTSDLYESVKTKLIAPNREAYLQTLDKGVLNSLAEIYGIKIIENLALSSINELCYPLVVKPRKSVYYLNNKLYRGFRKFVNNAVELSEALQSIRLFEPSPLVQRVIIGRGFGLFVAAKEGHIFAVFAHERIREVPPEGGVSCLRKSIPVNEHLLGKARVLIKALSWTGIAMLEFKGHDEQKAFLMEINGRPWGSMDLAVSAGMDFPKMLVDLFIEQTELENLQEKYSHSYAIDHYSKWHLGELNYLKHVLVSKNDLTTKCKRIAALVKSCPKSVSYDTFKIQDPLPFLFEFAFAMEAMVKKVVARNASSGECQ